MINKLKTVLTLLVLAINLSSCATRGPTIIKTYAGTSPRDKIAILRLKQKMKLDITYCDGFPVSKNAKYILLEPGRHEIGFEYFGTTLFANVFGHGKKYLEAEAGKTYMLRNRIAFFSFNPDAFPDVVDVTDNKKLHINEIPSTEKELIPAKGSDNND